MYFCLWEPVYGKQKFGGDSKRHSTGFLIIFLSKTYIQRRRAPSACGARGLRYAGSMVVSVVARIPLIWVDPRTAVRAWCMSGDPNCRNPPWAENSVACRSGALNGKPPFKRWKKKTIYNFWSIISRVLKKVKPVIFRLMKTKETTFICIAKFWLFFSFLSQFF